MRQAESIQNFFRSHFGQPPAALGFAPGRVNLIGEHTDYNEGLVLPMAIQFGVYAAGALAPDGQVQAVSWNFPEQPARFMIGDEPSGKSWEHYLRAILLELERAGVKPPGLRLAFHGDVPLEAGLSSSAAFSVVSTLVISALQRRTWDDPVEVARIGQAAEHRLGVNCGLLDQMASAACRAGSAMLLDCRDMHREMIAMDRERWAIFVGATGVRRRLAGSEYNRRRAECEQAARQCGKKSLREVSFALLERCRPQMPEAVFRRARHIVTENERVLKFVEALQNGDRMGAGRLLNESHASLRDDFEVSCIELDAMVESFMKAEGVFGARMVGGGFGGSAIALAEPAKTEVIIATAAPFYREKTGINGSFYVVAPGDGARVENLGPWLAD